MNRKAKTTTWLPNLRWRNACVSGWKNHDIKECLIKLTMLFYIFFILYIKNRLNYIIMLRIYVMHLSMLPFYRFLNLYSSYYSIFTLSLQWLVNICILLLAWKFMGKSKLTVNLSYRYFHLIFTDIYMIFRLFERNSFIFLVLF